MKNYFIFLILFLVMACSASTEKSNETKSNDAPIENETTDFMGSLELTIDGETFDYKAMTKSSSRLSFQNKGMAIYVENPNGEGSIAQIVIQSPDIYNGSSHSYTKGTIKRQEGMSEEEYQMKKVENRKRILSLKFRRIESLKDENYIELDEGTINFSYDDKKGDFLLAFEGKDQPSSYNKKEGDKVIAFSGKLELKSAYLMDSRD